MGGKDSASCSCNVLYNTKYIAVKKRRETRWRLPVGAQMLASTSYSVAQSAAEVGYEPEAAFNRAFQREFTLPPARFRSQARSVKSDQGA